MTQAGLALPNIEYADGGVRITIYRNTGVPKDVPKNVSKNVSKNVPEELTGIKKRIYELIQADPSVSRTQIAVECGMSVKTIARYLAEMEKIVRHVGPTHGGHWEIVPPADKK